MTPQLHELLDEAAGRMERYGLQGFSVQEGVALALLLRAAALRLQEKEGEDEGW